ncbi:MAG: hypothetical protein KJ718_00250 [Nanoarchaeota archaeon]|nr:hypothetical protein [Nanoarchaeota archaeon]MBU1050971.1 hypothetical protein [Nanoarchaeota archaeon]MBU1989027.1 hypothetical protein [Nanoarchaeota archaeon]
MKEKNFIRVTGDVYIDETDRYHIGDPTLNSTRATQVKTKTGAVITYFLRHQDEVIGLTDVAKALNVSTDSIRSAIYDKVEGDFNKSRFFRFEIDKSDRGNPKYCLRSVRPSEEDVQRVEELDRTLCIDCESGLDCLVA